MKKYSDVMDFSAGKRTELPAAFKGKGWQRRR